MEFNTKAVTNQRLATDRLTTAWHRSRRQQLNRLRCQYRRYSQLSFRRNDNDRARTLSHLGTQRLHNSLYLLEIAEKKPRKSVNLWKSVTAELSTAKIRHDDIAKKGNDWQK